MQEKMMILEMIKDNKINVDEGVKLLNAVGAPSSPFNNFTNNMKTKINNATTSDKQKFKENTQAFFNKTEQTFDDVANYMKDLFSSDNSNVSTNKTGDTSQDVINVTPTNQN